jgi:hypothetical protein
LTSPRWTSPRCSPRRASFCAPIRCRSRSRSLFNAFLWLFLLRSLVPLARPPTLLRPCSISPLPLSIPRSSRLVLVVLRVVNHPIRLVSSVPRRPHARPIRRQAALRPLRRLTRGSSARGRHVDTRRLTDVASDLDQWQSRRVRAVAPAPTRALRLPLVLPMLQWCRSVPPPRSAFVNVCAVARRIAPSRRVDRCRRAARTRLAVAVRARERRRRLASRRAHTTRTATRHRRHARTRRHRAAVRRAARVLRRQSTPRPARVLASVR